MILDTVDVKKKGVHTRYLILLIIFIVTAVNYADRATLSIAGTEVAKELQLSAVSMGYIFSAFGWAYLLMQIPGGWLLDKFGSKKVYTYSLFFWSLFTFLQGFVDMFPLAWAGISMFFMRFMLGFSEAPSFPADAPRDKCTLSCAINGIHAAFHYLKKNYISGCVMTVPTG